MTDFVIAILVVLLLYVGAFAGQRIRLLLPDTHRTAETVDFTKVVSSLLVTFTALVLSLLISSVNEDFKKTDTDLRDYASTIIRLDAELQDLGPAARPIQADLRRYTAAAVASTWPDEAPPGGIYPKATPHGVEIDAVRLGDLLHAVETDIRGIEPATPAARLARDECLTQMESLLDKRWALVSEAHSLITPPFFVVMLFWLVVVFVGFGLTAPANGVAIAFVLMVGLSVGAAIFVILELDGPLDGWIEVSSEPMRHALRHLDAALAAPVP